MSEHDGLVHYIIRRQWHGCLSYTEILQEGRIGLWRAIRGFDPRRGVTFATYASRAQRPAWLPPPPPATDPLPHLLEQEGEAALHALVEQLPPQQRRIVCAYYGLNGQGAHDLSEAST
jgi:DNA-directed RNA polymerase sigma subunit (sigma70/sigma32)